MNVNVNVNECKCVLAAYLVRVHKYKCVLQFTMYMLNLLMHIELNDDMYILVHAGQRLFTLTLWFAHDRLSKISLFNFE